MNIRTVQRTATAKGNAMSARKIRNDLYAYREKLPFFVARARRTGPRLNPWWNVSPTGDYGADYQTGAEYAAAFWRVCGKTGHAGDDLGQILFAMHAPGRKKSKRNDGLSGIEIGFIRGIGDIIDIMKVVPVLAAAVQIPERLKELKTRRRVKGARRAVGDFAKVTQMYLDGKQAQSRKRDEEIRKEIAENNRPALRARMLGQKAA